MEELVLQPTESQDSNNQDNIVIKVKNKRRSKEEIFKDAVIKRFSNAPWSKKRTVTLGGAGGIGSNIAYLLTKLGYDFYLFEFDVVEAHNIGGQNFDLNDVGRTKASSIIRKAGNINKRVKITPLGKLTEETQDEFIQEIVLSGFDSINARKILFEKWYRIHKDNPNALFIDGRMSAEDLEIYAVTPDRAEAYRETLFEDVIEELPCNYKATTQTGFIISGMMIGLMTNFITEIVEKEGIRVLPFRTAFNIPLMYYENN